FNRGAIFRDCGCCLRCALLDCSITLLVVTQTGLFLETTDSLTETRADFRELACTEDDDNDYENNGKFLPTESHHVCVPPAVGSPRTFHQAVRSRGLWPREVYPLTGF